MAVKAWDIELLDLFVSHGADPLLGSPLLQVVERYPGEVEVAMRGARTAPLPFSQRRATAEYLLRNGVGINDVKKTPCRDLTPYSAERLVEETALTVACAAEDWEFVEWLLERGADPELLGGRALREQWWGFPYYGRNDPKVVKELIEKAAAKQGEGIESTGLVD